MPLVWWIIFQLGGITERIYWTEKQWTALVFWACLATLVGVYVATCEITQRDKRKRTPKEWKQMGTLGGITILAAIFGFKVLLIGSIVFVATYFIKKDIEHHKSLEED